VREKYELDAAALILTPSLDLTSNNDIVPICLPPDGIGITDTEDLYLNETALISGWGIGRGGQPRAYCNSAQCVSYRLSSVVMRASMVWPSHRRCSVQVYSTAVLMPVQEIAGDH
jgi:hypothetical protein